MDDLFPRDEIQLRLTRERKVHVSERQIIAADRRGEIPHISVGRARYYSLADLDAWLASRRVNPKVPA